MAQAAFDDVLLLMQSLEGGAKLQAQLVEHSPADEGVASMIHLR